MKLIERQGDLFETSNEYYLAHCISADYALGAGIAKKFDSIYCMRSLLSETYPVPYGSTKYIGNALRIGNVFNLVTKRYCYQKPTFETLESSLIDMRTQCEELGIKKLAMPRIACGLDRLPWDGCEKCVSNLINNIFGDTDIEIVIYFYKSCKIMVDFF